MPSRSTVLVIALLIATSVTTLPAQRLEPPSFSFPAHGLNLQRMSWTAVATVEADDHTWEGAAIGAAVGGLVAFALRSSSCDDKATAPKDCRWRTLGWTLMGAAVGAFAGGLVASAIDDN